MHMWSSLRFQAPLLSAFKERRRPLLDYAWSRRYGTSLVLGWMENTVVFWRVKPNLGARVVTSVMSKTGRPLGVDVGRLFSLRTMAVGLISFLRYAFSAILMGYVSQRNDIRDFSDTNLFVGEREDTPFLSAVELLHRHRHLPPDFCCLLSSTQLTSEPIGLEGPIVDRWLISVMQPRRPTGLRLVRYRKV